MPIIKSKRRENSERIYNSDELRCSILFIRFSLFFAHLFSSSSLSPSIHDVVAKQNLKFNIFAAEWKNQNSKSNDIFTASTLKNQVICKRFAREKSYNHSHPSSNKNRKSCVLGLLLFVCFAHFIYFNIGAVQPVSFFSSILRLHGLTKNLNINKVFS